MKKVLCSIFMCFGSVCFADSSINEIPSFYIRPELYSMFSQHPEVINNGYVVADNKEIATKFFDHIPPEINFDSEDLVIFAWQGSGQDKIDYQKMENTYHFVYKKGMTKDLQQHIKIISVPKENPWIFHRVLD